MSNISTIEEIPLEPEAPLKKEEQDIRENEEENENIQENIQPVEDNIQPEIPKRGRGRPAGAKNKAKAPPPPKPKPVAPKPKAKKKQPEPVYEDDSSEDDYYQAPAPQYDSREIAAEVLGLLQHQKRQNNMARRNHYASWFQNM